MVLCSPSKANIWALHGAFATLDLPHPSDWVVVYQIWCLQSMQLKTKKRFYLPAEKVLSTRRARTTLQSQEFRFPVALSSSLRLVFIMGVILQVEDDGPTSTKVSKHLKHLLFDPRCPYGAWDEGMINDMGIDRPRYFHNSGQSHGPRDLSIHPCHKWFRCYFSPCEQYAVVIKGDSPPDAIRYKAAWVLDIHKRLDPYSPKFQLVATGIRLNGTTSHPVIFHPQKIVLAMSKAMQTVLWRVSSGGKRPSSMKASKVTDREQTMFSLLFAIIPLPR
jgi:hypothetical protein